MFINPFKLYDEMLGIYAPKEKEIEWVTCEYTVPEPLADELDELVAKFLKDNGHDIN